MWGVYCEGLRYGVYIVRVYGTTRGVYCEGLRYGVYIVRVYGTTRGVYCEGLRYRVSIYSECLWYYPGGCIL